MRNLTKTLTAVSLMAPFGAYPLGIGDIKLHSALNQNLEAEISLVLSDSENIEDLRINLAPPEKFVEAGVPWTFFLSKIKFKPVVKPDGTVVIKLTSTEVLKEPFLDFLLKVTWPQGDLYREFTVLVDPPAVYKQAVIPVIANNRADTGKADTSPVTKTSTTGRSAVQVSNAESGEYGPTGKYDTLWKIAEKVNTDQGISVEQMMMALYHANPDAFINDNVNYLKTGRTLRVPESEVVLKLSQRQARFEFRNHVKAWKAEISDVAETPTDEVITETVADANRQLKLKPPIEEEITDNSVVTPGVTESDPIVDTTAATNDQILVQENQQLQDRISKLEQQFAQMQQLLAAKDQQLAAALQGVKSKPEGKLLPMAPKQIESVLNPAVKEQAAVKPTQQAVQETKQTAKPKPKAKPKSVVKAEPESESNLFYYVASGLGAGVLGLLGWLWWRQRKIIENRSNESIFASSSEISLPETDQDLSVAIVDDGGSDAYDVGTVGESSFLSEFTPSDFDAFDSDQAEVDPISEADVYLAYGRYQQAEELMRQAIEEQPDRDSCKLKLLEIFYASENKQAFEDYAGELAGLGKKEDADFWNKVIEMGNEICPASALFANDAGVDSTAVFETQTDDIEAEFDNTLLTDPLASANGVDTSPVDFDLSAIDEEAKPELEKSPSSENDLLAANDDSGLDFDLNSNIENEQSPEASEAIDFTTAADNEKIESLSTEQLGEESPSIERLFDQQSEAAEEQRESDNIKPLDFDLSPDSNLDEDVNAQLEGSDNLDSFDFSSVEQETTDTLETEVAADGLDIDFELDIPDETSSEEDSQEDAMPVSDLTDMDEFETKIDLAKAYIDMGDADAAKNIVKEVLTKGSDEQKQEAKSILESLT